MQIWVLVTGLLLSGMPALAAETAHDLYREGSFDAAARAAVEPAGNGAARLDYALAARAKLAKIYYAPDLAERSSKQRLADLKQARQWAEKAVAARPGHVEGYLQLVVALGHEGLNRGPVAVFFSGIIGKSRQLLQQARQMAPESPWVYGLVGGWNLELVRNAGTTFAGDNKASIDQGIAAYQEALRLAPDNALLRTEYALTLLLIDRDAYRDRARGILSGLDLARSESLVEKIALARGEKALALLNAGDGAGLDHFLDRIDRLRSVE